MTSLYVRPWHELFTPTPHPCAVCGGPCHTVDVCFEAPLHLGTCAMQMERDYWEAVLR